MTVLSIVTTLEKFTLLPYKLPPHFPTLSPRSLALMRASLASFLAPLTKILISD